MIFSLLNKFLKLILGKLIILYLLLNVKVKKNKSRVARSLTYYVILIFVYFVSVRFNDYWKDHK